jgi:uncharacterized membrane protein YbaN (DUF454 family)
MSASPSRTRVVVDWIVGLTLVLVGIIGGFIPILQGWVFVLAGLAVLSSHSRWARAILNSLKAAGRKLRRQDGESRDTR